MATKPASTYQWGTDGTNDAAPSGGKQALGWEVGEQPPATYFNWWMKGVGKWMAYLSDGAFTGAATFASTVGITGALTLVGQLVTGAVAAANQHFTVSGTGRFKHGDIPYSVPGSAFQVISTAGQWAAGTVPEFDGAQWSFTSAGGGSLAAPIFLPVGKRIRSIVWHFNKGGSASSLTMRLRKKSAGSGAATVVTYSDATSGGSYTTRSETGIDYTVESGYQVYLEVIVGNVAHIFGYAVVTFDEP